MHFYIQIEIDGEWRYLSKESDWGDSCFLDANVEKWIEQRQLTNHFINAHLWTRGGSTRSTAHGRIVLALVDKFKVKSLAVRPPCDVVQVAESFLVDGVFQHSYKGFPKNSSSFFHNFRLFI